MVESFFECEECNYKTRHAGHWKRHLESHSHRKKSNALVLTNHEDSVLELKEKNNSLKETVRQIHELLIKSSEENSELRQKVSELQRECCLLKQINQSSVTGTKKVGSREETRINNTFIFVIDGHECESGNLMDVMSNMHAKIKADNGGRVGNSQVVMLGLNDIVKTPHIAGAIINKLNG